MAEQDTDDEFEAIVDSHFDHVHGGELGGSDNREQADKLAKISPRDDQPRVYDTDLNSDVESAVQELKDKAENRETATKYYKHWHDLAKQNNMTVRDYLDRVYNIEQTLHRNPAQGFAAIANNIGITPAQVIQGMAHMMHGDMQSGGTGNGATTAAHAAAAHDIDSVVAAAERNIPDFKRYEDGIVAILNNKQFARTGNPAADLSRAYEMAKRWHQQAEVERAKHASKSLGGGSGSKPGYTTRERAGATYPSPNQSYESDLDADVRRAFAARGH